MFSIKFYSTEPYATQEENMHMISEIISFFYFLTPISPCYFLCKKRIHPSKVSMFYIIARMIFSVCQLGVELGDKGNKDDDEKKDVNYTILNFIELILHTVFSFILVSYKAATNKKLCFTRLLLIISLVIFSGIGCILGKLGQYTTYKEIIEQFFTPLMYLTVGANICKLMREKDPKYISIISCFGGVVVNALWLTYWIFSYLNNKASVIPLIMNFICITLCLAQIVIFFIYKSSYKSDSDFSYGSGGVHMPLDVTEEKTILNKTIITY